MNTAPRRFHGADREEMPPVPARVQSERVAADEVQFPSAPGASRAAAILAAGNGFPRCISPFPARATVRQADSSTLRRLRRRLGHVPGVLPISIAARLLVRRRYHPPPASGAAIGPARRATVGESLLPAGRSSRALSVARRNPSCRSYSRRTDGFDRLAVHPAQRHQPARAELARPPAR